MAFKRYVHATNLWMKPGNRKIVQKNDVKKIPCPD